ncbi:hypothetical protein [Bradyrhizobium sp.]|uniref:hypothetical protein n=1 Tax=Bradyrhizobium sp. TaxID=376 RepID=UPI0040381278
MKPLVLTGCMMSDFMSGGFADLVFDLASFNFIWGPQPSSSELAAYLGPRTADPNSGTHWSGWGGLWSPNKNKKHRNLSLAEFCQYYETVELWFDMRPRAQLKLIWLLDYFSSYPDVAPRLKLRLVDRDMMEIHELGTWRPTVIGVSEREFETASAAWQAYRAATPEACFDLFHRDLSALPLLRPALRDLLAELPSTSTGLGASEMRMLEMIGRGYSRTRDISYCSDARQTHVFNEFELGYLLDGLAFGPRPAITGLDEELRTIRQEISRARDRACRRSRLSLTDFGKAVVAHKEDFSRHNPIDRWWGGTHLTNDNLWRWSPALVKP